MSLSVYSPGSASGTGTGVGGAYTGVLLNDINGFLWDVTVSTFGNLVTTIVGTVQPGNFYPNQWVMPDSTGAFWTFTVSTTGNLVSAVGGTFFQAVNFVVINDSTFKSWVVRVTTTGNLVTS